MVIDARPASVDDARVIADLYRELAEEMDALRPLWSAAEGLGDPIAETLPTALGGPPWWGYVGQLDGVPVGFLLGRDEPLLPPAAETPVAAIRFIYTVPGARQVGVGEAMMDAFMIDARARGITLFDAHVSPGHRESKNFFESHGFTARSIVMHRSDA
ncbi:MAG: GNAT family N-acetyltransferase [Actinomycetota bacterium]